MSYFRSSGTIAQVEQIERSRQSLTGWRYALEQALIGDLATLKGALMDQ